MPELCLSRTEGRASGFHVVSRRRVAIAKRGGCAFRRRCLLSARDQGSLHFRSLVSELARAAIYALCSLSTPSHLPSFTACAAPSADGASLTCEQRKERTVTDGLQAFQAGAFRHPVRVRRERA